MNRNVRLIYDAGNQHGEGPVWSPESQTLYWTDIEAPALCRFRPDTEEYEEIPLEDKLCSFAIINKDTILAAFTESLAVFDLETREILRRVSVETDVEGTRMNDGRTDRGGHFILSGFDTEGSGRSGVYFIGRNLKINRWFGGISSGNSICFSPDGRTMYFADSPEAVIWAYDYESLSGSLGDRRLLYDFKDEPGLPDGSMVDSEGYLWNAEWNGHRVIRISPEGRLDDVVEIPVKNPTCVSFGGTDLKTMYVTTSRLMMGNEELALEPSSGGLFAFDLSVPGLVDAKYML